MSGLQDLSRRFADSLFEDDGGGGDDDAFATPQKAASVTFNLGKTAVSGKRYKLYCVPTTDDEYERACFTMIGKGETFCTDPSCSKTHQGVAWDPPKGELHIAKTATTAYFTPSLPLSRLHAELAKNMTAASLSLDDWLRFFTAATGIPPELPITTELLQAEYEDIAQAHLQRTPRKSKTLSAMEDAAGNPAYTKQVNDPTDLEQQGTLNDVAKTLCSVDNEVAKTSKTLNDTVRLLLQEQQTNHTAHKTAAHRIHEVESSLGKRGRNQFEGFESVTVWGTLATVLDMMASFDDALTDPPSSEDVLALEQKMISEIAAAKTESQASVSRLESSTVSTMSQLYDRFKELAARSSGGSNPEIQRLSNTVDAMQAQGNPTERLNQLETAFARIQSTTDTTRVRFGGLGFGSFPEASLWLDTECPDFDCGHFVDAHVLFQHILVRMTGGSNLKMLTTLKKAGIATGNFATTVESFDHTIPTFFCSPGVGKPIDVTHSFFDKIPSYADWSIVSTGYKDKLELHLRDVRFDIESSIRDVYDYSSRQASLMQAALSRSAEWIHGFVRFIDDYYNDLNRSRYSTAKAWHLVTSLGYRLISEIAKPRRMAPGALNADNQASNNKVMFFAILRSLDIMEEIMDKGFRDHPIVANELVRFLAKNTGQEAIDVLQRKMAAAEDVIKQQAKDLNAQEKLITTLKSTAKTNGDELKALKSRITKLEQKAHK